MNEILEDTKNADIFKDKYEHQKWSNYYNNSLNLCYKYIPQEAGVKECLLSPLNQPFLHESKCVTNILVQKGNYQKNCKWARAIVHSFIDTSIFVQVSFPRDRSEFTETLMADAWDGWFVCMTGVLDSICLFVCCLFSFPCNFITNVQMIVSYTFCKRGPGSTKHWSHWIMNHFNSRGGGVLRQIIRNHQRSKSD